VSHPHLVIYILKIKFVGEVAEFFFGAEIVFICLAVLQFFLETFAYLSTHPGRRALPIVSG
jgi:hypothetical protein